MNDFDSKKYAYFALKIAREFDPKRVLDYGCGVGKMTKALRSLDIYCRAYDPMRGEAGFNPYDEPLETKVYKTMTAGKFDLVIAMDVLEHLTEDELEVELSGIRDRSKRLFCMIPAVFDADLYKDPTHKIFKTKGWWMWKLSKWWPKVREVEDWTFAHKIIIAEA